MSRLVAHIASHVRVCIEVFIMVHSSHAREIPRSCHSHARVVSAPMWSYFYQDPVSLKLTELAPHHEKATTVTTLSVPDPDRRAERTPSLPTR